MALKKIYVGSVGPLLYDDADPVNDPDGDFAGESHKAVITDGQLLVEQGPTAGEEVIRLVDLGYRLMPPVSVVNIDNPTELNTLAGNLGALVLAYQIVGAAGLNEYTIYAYDASGPAVSVPYIMDADGAGAERWIAIAGKYASQDYRLNVLTASRLVSSDASKGLASVANLANWIAGTANEITVINDGDGSVTLEGAGSDTDFTVVVAIQAGGGGGIGFQYKTRALTLNGGIISTVGAESGWNDI